MSNSQSKVSSGPPIWLWLILVPVTLAVIGGVIVSSIPPDLDKVYAEAKELLIDPNRSEEFEKKMRLLEADPAYADHVSMLRGRIALAQNREPMALKFFSRVAEGSSLESEAAQRSGDAHRRAGDFEKAVGAYRLGLEKDTGDGLKSRMNLASLYFMAGGIDLAMDQLNQNIEIDSAHEPSRILRAKIRIFRDEFETAREDFEAVLDSPGKFSSSPPDFVAEYFKCLVQLDDVAKLEEVAKAHLGTISDQKIKSSVLCKLGAYRDAMVALQSMEGPESQSAASKAAKLELLLSEGNLNEAKLLAKELITLVPRDITTMKLAAKTFEASGETRLQKIAEENVDQLLDLKRQLRAAIDEVSGNITDGPGRAKVAKLFGEMTDFRQMDSWFQVAVMLDNSLNAEFMKARSGEGLPSGPLVSFDEPTEKDIEKESAETPKAEEKEESPKEAAAKKDDAKKAAEDDVKPKTESDVAKDKSEATEKPATEKRAVQKPAVEVKKAKEDGKQEAQAATKED